MKIVSRYAYFIVVTLVALSWLGFWISGQTAEIPNTLFPLLIPRACWRWMWSKTHVRGRDAQSATSNQRPMSPPC